MAYNYNKYKHLSAKEQAIIKNVEDNKELQRERDRETIIDLDIENLELLKNLLDEHYEVVEEKENENNYRVILKKEDDVRRLKINNPNNINIAKEIINSI